MSASATEAFDRRLEHLADWPIEDALAALWEGQLAAVAAIGAALPAIAAATGAASERLLAHPAGRLAYAGAGSSARIGAQDGAELAPTFDWPEARLVLLPAGGTASLAAAVENAEDDEAAARDAVAAAGLGTGDVLIGIAASGSTPFTCAAVSAARERGALTISLSSSPDGRLLRLAEWAILVLTQAEPIAGSTRMKAGTAQKVVLNLISTGIMLRLGRVHRGRMIAMRPRNAKLRARAVRMVGELTGCAPEAAAALLARSGGVAEAVLVDAGCTPEAAVALLARHDGVLSRALAQARGRP